MKKRSMQGIRNAGCSTLLLLGGLAQAQTPDAGGPAAGLETLQRELAEQATQLDAMKRALAEQEAVIRELRSVISNEILATKRGGQGVGGGVSPANNATNAATAAAAASAAQSAPNAVNNPQQITLQPPQDVAQGPQAGESANPQTVAVEEPVGRPPERETRPPEIAPIIDQPGVLTAQGKLVVEPGFQYGYSSNNRVALVGYTVIPAILIGLLDVREVKTSTYIPSIALRYGVTKRLEVEAKVPYVKTSGSTISREVFTGTAVDNVFNASGAGLGDVEATVRYQLNYGNEKMPYFVGWLRYKSATGKDPFEVVTDCVTRCVGNTTGTGLPLGLPTGTGFQAIQPGITWLLPTDPAVFFGTFSYLHNFARDNVSRTVLNGQTENLGKIAPGDIFEFSFGMGLSLNEKASFSIGYDQAIIWPTKQNGQTVPGSVRITQGTLLVGYSYRFNDRYTLNLSVGAGLTRDTPDLQVNLRLPITF
ncbi:acetate kinase [Cupriavidus consociatus]|uniref:acetate kinase n=1 Tax=Cupriavidus consociatus TaxID=2821357 RepID=UPI001AE7EF7A|nr:MULTISPECIES: acetate kinase [unclassified Cupriavidus]MBP0623570.1 acetate kinase [Cupriavidus sp. LEh25]MDK2660273.1 acetate kinase [Cupriavidus sp. LEh21]